VALDSGERLAVFTTFAGTHVDSQRVKSYEFFEFFIGQA
jgi:hypothetical protein